MTSLSADDAYLSHYGFSHDPFAARVPGFKFFPAQRKPVLGQLHHLARYSQLLLLVTGPEGSGKTLLRQALVASSNKQAVQSVVITPQDTTDSTALIAQIAQALNSREADFEGVMAQVVQLALTGQEVYLLVDDAERLTAAAIETLLRLAAGVPEARPHVFLFGETALAGRLEALSEGDERYHVIALQPYEEDETREYLALRLEGAGSGIDCLSEEQIARIHDESGGWPGSINQIARDELLAAMQGSRGRHKAGGIGFALPRKHVLAALAVVLLVAVAFLLLRGQDVRQSVAPEVTQLPLDTAATADAGQEPAGQDGQAAIEFDGSERPLSLPLGNDAQPVIREPLAAAAGGEDESGVAMSDSDDSEPVNATSPVAPAPAPAPAPPLPLPLRKYRSRLRRSHPRPRRRHRRLRQTRSLRDRALLQPSQASPPRLHRPCRGTVAGMRASLRATTWSRFSAHVPRKMRRQLSGSKEVAIAISSSSMTASRSMS